MLHVDVYSTDNDLEAKHVIGLLRDEGIDATEINNQISAFPLADQSQIVVAVPKKMVEHARKVIDQARKDGIIA